MSEEAKAQLSLNDRAQLISEQLKARIEQVRQDSRERYNKVEARVTELLEEYKRFESPVDALKEGGNKLQQTARDFQQQQIERLGGLSNQLVSRLGLPTSDEVKALEKKVKALNTKIKKIEKAAKA